MKKFFKKSLSLILVIATLVSTISITGITSNAASQVYYPIDFSADVIKSRILSVPGTKDCGLVSICTIEAYLYGATTTAEKNKVYDAVINKNLGTTSGKPNNNAVQSWGALGYATTGYGNFSLQTLYNQLAQGYPCLVHRTSSAGEHWSVVCGYTGSTSKLEKSGFIVVDIEDITPFKKTLTSWQGSNTLDNIGYRKNGISIIMNTSGIRMAINHPKLVHPYSNGHGVYGYITSTAKLTSITVRVSNANTGAYVFNKTLNPAATSYNIYKLDSSMTFAKWAKGNYYYTVAAIDANGNSRVYEKFFTISSSWPATVTGAKHTFSFNANGGSGSMSSITLEHGGNLTIPACKFTKSGYTFSGYNVYRSDGKWYSSGSSWLTESEIVANGSSKVVYPAGKVYVINNSWTKGGAIGANYTFYPIWTANHTHSYTSKVTKAATCTENGVRTYSCTCGDSYTEAIAKIAHSYTSKVTKDPTCTENGVRTYSCTCGDSYTEAIVALGHDDGRWVTAKEATTAEEGLKELRCTVCAYVLDTEVIPKLPEIHTHSYTSEITAAPTCTEDGTITYSCSCGDSYTEAIAAVGHDDGVWVTTKLATQTEEGLSELKCSVCGFVISAKVIPVLEDSFVNPFTDVKDSYWFAEAVFYCVKRGYASGMTETTFVPNGKLTRAQFLTLLAKLDCAKLSDYEGIDSGFNDVRATHWYNEVVCWAVEKGYTSGLSDTKFGPNNYITRAQLARFFYVYSEKNGINIENTADTSAFPDAAKVPSWAKIPVEWAVVAGLISGVKDNGKDYLDPNGTATRAQAVVMFKAFDSFRGVEE